MTGMHPVQSYGHTLQGASTSQVAAGDRDGNHSILRGFRGGLVVRAHMHLTGLCASEPDQRVDRHVSHVRRCTKKRRCRLWRRIMPVSVHASSSFWSKATRPDSATICAISETRRQCVTLMRFSKRSCRSGTCASHALSKDQENSVTFVFAKKASTRHD